MKKTLFTIGLLLPTLALAQQYSIDWYKVGSGGGTSTGGAYSLGGTIGQHDAGGPMAGNKYSLTGGFWAPYAVQTPGAPLLRIFLTDTNTAIVAWPTSSAPFSLEQNPVLGSTNWFRVTNAPIVVGSENQVIVARAVGARFYRLKYP